MSSVATSITHPIRVDWIPNLSELALNKKFELKGRLGMTFGPGKVQPYSQMGLNWQRDVEIDVKALREVHKMDVLISLMESHEYKTLCMTTLFDTCKRYSVEVVHFPIRDSSIPSSCKVTRPLVKQILALLSAGKSVVVHCMGGLGRTGTICACTLVHIGQKPDDAIRLVRRARKGTVENTTQMKFVHKYEKALAKARANAKAKAATKGKATTDEIKSDAKTQTQTQTAPPAAEASAPATATASAPSARADKTTDKPSTSDS